MNKKVTELTEATEINNDDLFMIVQSGENKKMSASLIMGTVLYEDETGTAGDIILNESIENYNSYKIYGYYNHLGNYTKFCKEFDVDSRNRIDLSGNSYNGGSFTYLANEIATISGNIITRGTQYEDSLAGGGVDNSRSSGEYVYITKVVAYK